MSCSNDTNNVTKLDARTYYIRSQLVFNQNDVNQLTTGQHFKVVGSLAINSQNQITNRTRIVHGVGLKNWRRLAILRSGTR